MISRIFVDTNVPIYASGSSHPLKNSCIAVLRLISDYPRGFWTHAEVLQELLHRYRAINRWTVGKVVFDAFAELMAGQIEPIFAQDVQIAAKLGDGLQGLDARDLLHVAVMTRTGTSVIVSADRGFDSVSDVVRLDPSDVETWRDQTVS